MGDFKHHEMSDEQSFVSNMIIENADSLYTTFDDFLVPSRETSLAKTKLEEAVMWAKKSIVINGVKE